MWASRPRLSRAQSGPISHHQNKSEAKRDPPLSLSVFVRANPWQITYTTKYFAPG
jgi:hypothetical protein